MLQKNNIGELATPTHERVQSQYSPSDNQIQTTKKSPVLLWMPPSGSYLAIINNVSWGGKALRMLLVTWVLEDWAAGSLTLWPNAGNVASEADSIGTKLIILVLTLKLKQKRRWGNIVIILLNKTFHPPSTESQNFLVRSLDKNFQWLKL